MDSDCVFVGGGVGLCQPSISSVRIVLASFTVKAFLFPDTDNTVNVKVRLLGTDDSGADWVAQGSIAASLNDFNNCSCTLTQ